MQEALSLWISAAVTSTCHVPGRVVISTLPRLSLDFFPSWLLFLSTSHNGGWDQPNESKGLQPEPWMLPITQSMPAYLHLSLTASHHSILTHGWIYLQRHSRTSHGALCPLDSLGLVQTLINPPAYPACSFPQLHHLLQHHHRHHSSKCVTSGVLLGAIKHLYVPYLNTYIKHSFTSLPVPAQFLC